MGEVKSHPWLNVCSDLENCNSFECFFFVNAGA